MIADMLSNKKHNPVVSELFIRDRKLHISLVFMTQSYFAVLKIIRLILGTIFLWKFQTNENLQEIVFNHLSDVDFKDVMNPVKNLLQNSILFKLLMLFLDQVILHISERIF